MLFYVWSLNFCSLEDTLLNFNLKLLYDDKMDTTISVGYQVFENFSYKRIFYLRCLFTSHYISSLTLLIQQKFSFFLICKNTNLNREEYLFIYCFILCYLLYSFLFGFILMVHSLSNSIVFGNMSEFYPCTVASKSQSTYMLVISTAHLSGWTNSKILHRDNYMRAHLFLFRYKMFLKII